MLMVDFSWDRRKDKLMELFNLEYNNAVVVGGCGELGYAQAEGLAEAGASVVLIDIVDKVEEFAGKIKTKVSSVEVYGIQADISDREKVRDSWEQALAKLDNKVDILVNAAGIQRRTISEDFSEKDWDDVLSVNLTAPFLYCQLAARNMLPRNYGKIINVASIQSYCGGYTIPAYTATKGGICQLTKTLSNDWGGRGLNVNAIAPGYMATQLNTALIADEIRSKEILARIPQKRWGTPEDMKGLTIFLASHASDFMNGTCIPLDGGYLGR